MAHATLDPVRLPPGPTAPRIVQGAAMLLNRPRALEFARRRHGSA